MPVGSAGAVAVNLTDKQERFAILLAAGKHQNAAYREAYPASQKWTEGAVAVAASRAASNAKVVLRVASLRQPILEAVIKRVVIDRDWVLNQLIENVAMAKSAIPVLDKEGNPVGAYKIDLSAANTALKMIGMEVPGGMFIERKEAGKPGAFASLPPADREKALEQSIKERMVRLGLARAERAPNPPPKGSPKGGNGAKVVPIGSAKKRA